jgi:hypothetical protein
VLDPRQRGLLQYRDLSQELPFDKVIRHPAAGGEE